MRLKRLSVVTNKAGEVVSVSFAFTQVVINLMAPILAEGPQPVDLLYICRDSGIKLAVVDLATF
jgi:hypothetical protein